jgi:CBS domain-containing protein
MKVDTLMTHDVRCCRASDSLNVAAQMMWDFDIGSVPVVDEDHRAIGMITDRDVAMAAYTRGRRLADIRVDETISRKLHSVRAGDDSADVEALMRNAAVRRVPVLDDEDHLVGIVSLDDLALNARADGPLSYREVAETFAAVSGAQSSSSRAAS